jgi:ribosomal protein S4
MGLARVTALTADGITEPSSALMTAMSSLNRRIRIKQQTKVSRFSRIQVEHNKMRCRASKKRSFRDALASFKAKNTSSIPSRLVTSVTRFSPVTPLLFQQPITQAVKSAAKKEQEALAALAAKEERFKLTAQYVESVTALIPDLMNYMLSRRIENTKVTYNTAKHLVKNIYWSLRVYLNVDPFDTRFFIRDKVPAVRVRLFENISDLAESQKTLQPQRAELRYRFQPSKLLLAPNTMRFRKDWLRAFFPAKHALYQENEEDYGKFLLETDKIRSFRFGPRGMDTWITTHQVAGQETRARQLLRLRCSKRRPRFETVLQTTRRAPVLERAPANAATHTKDSFFRRKFSTYSGRSLSLVSSWMHRRKRFISLEDTWRTLSPITLVGARNRTIARVEARGRTGYVGAKRAGLTISTLDGRFARAKSPRSRQYILRSQKKLIDAERPDVSAKLQFYKNLLEERFQAQHTGRKLRWTRAKRAHVGYAFKRFTEQSPVATLRTKQHFRRAQTVAATSARMQQNSKTKRPLIRYRSASARTSSVRYRKGVAVPAHSVFANTQYLALLKAQRKNSKIKRRSRAHIRKTWTLFPRRLRHSSLNAKGNLFHRKTVSHRALNYKSYFHSEARRYFLRTLDFTRAVGLYKRFYRQAPFEIHRSRLWNRLTRRWMKKHRIARYWLRDAIHWLKDPWLSQIVAPDMGLRRDRYGGELRSIPQQVGEYVAEVDAQGRDIKRKDAPARERHKYQELMPVLSPERDPEIKKTNKNLKRGSAVTQMITRHRLQIAAEARRKPVPTMRLANYEYRDVIREHKENYAKSAKQKEEEEKARVTAYWARKAKKLPPVRPKRLPLKHPANLWLPHVIWKEIQRRIKKFEWRESDDVFVRAGMRNAFRFRPNERRATPWLEHLMYTRATYSTRLAEFRRRQFPHEQKKFKWLQRVRKVLYSPRTRYFKRKRWPQLRRYNQKLHYSLFKLRDRGAARKHFKKVAARSRPAISAYIAMSKGLTDRLDVTCLQMGFAPTIYWARIVSEFGLLRVNGRTVYNPAYRLKPADVIYPNWDTVIRFQHYFMPQMRRRALRLRKNRMLASFYPKNMEYHKGTRAIIYKHAPDESDLRRSSRIRPAYFRWFRLDSV